MVSLETTLAYVIVACPLIMWHPANNQALSKVLYFNLLYHTSIAQTDDL